MIDIFKHLLPTGRAWSITVDKPLRRFFAGLAAALFDARAFIDAVYSNLWPDSTGHLAEWEAQLGLPASPITEAERRARLLGRWQAVGGQSHQYIEDALRAAGFDVYVHEWWAPSVRPSGGSVGGDAAPVARNPFTHLWDGVSPREYVGIGHDLAYSGGAQAYSGRNSAPPGYPLANKVLLAYGDPVGLGHVEMMSGGDHAYSGAGLSSYSYRDYVMPPDPATYPYYIYVGAQAFPAMATVPAGRRDEFEDLCLRLRPLGLWVGMLVNYA